MKKETNRKDFHGRPYMAPECCTVIIKTRPMMVDSGHTPTDMESEYVIC